MPQIEAYRFGRMIIDGEAFTRDLIIFPDNRISSPWWRGEGHRLAAADLTELIAVRPEIIIAGTGASGLMLPEQELVRLLTEEGIQFSAMPTGQAVKEYNRLAGSTRAGACFHLTC